MRTMMIGGWRIRRNRVEIHLKIRDFDFDWKACVAISRLDGPEAHNVLARIDRDRKFFVP